MYPRYDKRTGATFPPLARDVIANKAYWAGKFEVIEPVSSSAGWGRPVNEAMEQARPYVANAFRRIDNDIEPCGLANIKPASSPVVDDELIQIMPGLALTALLEVVVGSAFKSHPLCVLSEATLAICSNVERSCKGPVASQYEMYELDLPAGYDNVKAQNVIWRSKAGYIFPSGQGSMLHNFAVVALHAKACRITSYNVCYTKLLRAFACSATTAKLCSMLPCPDGNM